MRNAQVQLTIVYTVVRMGWRGVPVFGLGIMACATLKQRNRHTARHLHSCFYKLLQRRFTVQDT